MCDKCRWRGGKSICSFWPMLIQLLKNPHDTFGKYIWSFWHIHMQHAASDKLIWSLWLIDMQLLTYPHPDFDNSNFCFRPTHIWLRTHPHFPSKKSTKFFIIHMQLLTKRSCSFWQFHMHLLTNAHTASDESICSYWKLQICLSSQF